MVLSALILGGLCGGLIRSWLNPRARLSIGCIAKEPKGLLFNGILGVAGSLIFVNYVSPYAMVVPGSVVWLAVLGIIAGYAVSDIADSVIFVIKHPPWKIKKGVIIWPWG